MTLMMIAPQLCHRPLNQVQSPDGVFSVPPVDNKYSLRPPKLEVQGSSLDGSTPLSH